MLYGTEPCVLKAADGGCTRQMWGSVRTVRLILFLRANTGSLNLWIGYRSSRFRGLESLAGPYSIHLVIPLRITSELS